MEAITNFLYWLDDLLWGNAMTVIVVGTGILLSLRFAFRYQRNIRFNFKNTFGKMFDRGEGEGTISGFQAACTALANTIGTGNISGVATAIVSGGPGALVWMWVSVLRATMKPPKAPISSARIISTITASTETPCRLRRRGAELRREWLLLLVAMGLSSWFDTCVRIL